MMYLTETRAKDIVKQLMENDHPQRISENLQYYCKEHKLGARYWAYISDALTSLFPRFTFEILLDFDRLIVDDKKLTTKSDKLQFVFNYVFKEQEKEIQSRRFDTRIYSLSDLNSLVYWIGKKIVDPNGIRYKLNKRRVDFYTNKVLELVLKDNLFEEDNLMTINKNNLSLYVRIYFSIPIPQENLPSLNDVVLYDYRKVKAPVSYQVIGGKNKKKDYNSIFQQRYAAAKSKFGCSKSAFERTEVTRWRKVRSLYGKSTTEYNLINRYIQYIPALKIDNTTTGAFSFAISPDYKNKLIELLGKIEKAKTFSFLYKGSTVIAFVEILISEDYQKLKAKPIKFACETYLVVYFFDRLKKLLRNSQLTALKISNSRLFMIPTSHRKPSLAVQQKDFVFSYLKRTNYTTHLQRLSDKRKADASLDMNINFIDTCFKDFKL